LRRFRELEGKGPLLTRYDGSKVFVDPHVSGNKASPELFARLEHEKWQESASRYEEFFGGLVAQTVEALLEAAKVEKGSVVLDVGTGTGHVAAAAARRGAKVTAIDFSRNMIREAKKRNPVLDFREADAHRLNDFADNTLDAVLANFVLFHFAQPEVAVKEFHRVLKPGGRLAFTVWDRPDKAQALGIVLHAVQTHGDPHPAKLPTGPEFFLFSDDRKTNEMLKAAGFDISDIEIGRVPTEWRLHSGDDLFEAFLTATSRLRATLEAQEKESLAQIREDIIARARQYRTGQDGLVIPMDAVLVCGVKHDSPA
jgi:ubiquinone/menaquinone biosynthesis C-methylase UbiE